MSLQMVTRAEWGAMPPCHLDPLRPPVIDVGFVHSISLSCNDREECCKLMRFMQRCHMGKYQMADMKHNFYISSDGTVYEGRGWLANTSNYDPGYDDQGMKGKVITIARIGLDFQDNPITPEELAAKESIVKYGIENKYISPKYRETEGAFWQLFGESLPPENPTYKLWQPPPCLEKEKTILYKCSTSSEWVKMMEEDARTVEK